MTFTASQISQALGRTRQAVRLLLAQVPASSKAVVKGNEADAWLFTALPFDLQTELVGIAKARGFADTHDLLVGRPAPWQPRVPISDASHEAVDYAVKWRTILQPFLRVKDSDSRSQAEWEVEAKSAHQRVFGNPGSGRWIRKRFAKIIERDNGLEDWTRLELYLAENIGAQPEAAGPDEKKFNHDDLAADIESIMAMHPLKGKEGHNKLTKPQKKALWTAAWKHLDELASVCPVDREAVKRSIRRFLFSAVPMLAQSPEALKRNFDRKCAALESSGGKPSAIDDGRELRSGPRRGPEITEEDHKAIVAYSVLNCGSRVAPAWRAFQRGNIPGVMPGAQLVNHYTDDPASKSYVPPRIREDVKHEIAAMKPIHHGPHQYGQTAHLSLDDSKIFAGDYWCSDDTTLPVYFTLPDREVGFTLMRGQFLATVDHRSRCILGFVLIPGTAYDSIAVRNHIVDVADEHGLPRRGFIWERGLWKTAKLLKGDANADFVPPEEAEHGLMDFGLKFFHRHSAKGKIIERVFGLLQDRMEGEPGYCGRNEQTERHEPFHRLRADVEAGRVNPEGKLYTFEQWVARLHRICSDYNTEQYGRDTDLAGLSPRQAYEQWQDINSPAVKLEDSLRYLLSTHRRALPVTPNGICFTVGKRSFIYRNEQTGALPRGKKVLLWFNPESPDVAFVTDLHRQNPFAVELAKGVPTVGAPEELLADEMRKMRGHQAPLRALYRTLKAEFQPKFRQFTMSPGTIAAMDRGEAFAEGEKQIRDRQTTNARHVRSARHAAAAIGAALPSTMRNPVRVREDAEGEQEILQRIARKAQGTPQTTL